MVFMELRQLEYFLVVVKSGAFSRAAIQLRIGQPALSRQMKSLEEELGTDLFYRNGRGVVLSEAGKVLEKHAHDVLTRTAKAKSEIGALGTTPTGMIAIGMPISVGAVLTVPLVKHFNNAFPNVSLRVMEGFSGHVLDWLLTGEIEVGILYDVPKTNSLLMDPLVTEELALLGPVADPAQLGTGPVQASRIATLPLILPSRPHGLRLLVERSLARIGVCANIQYEINAVFSTLSLVESGAGYTILPLACIDQQISDGRLKSWSIIEPSITRSLVLATSTQRAATKATRALTRIVRTEVNFLVKHGRWTRPRCAS
jgi:LysR family nitrogen assimilation transcriptional regulator